MNDAKSEGTEPAEDRGSAPAETEEGPQGVGSGAELGGDPEELAGALAELGEVGEVGEVAALPADASEEESALEEPEAPPEASSEEAPGATEAEVGGAAEASTEPEGAPQRSHSEDPEASEGEEETAAPAEVDPESLVPVLEAILFASPEPLTAAALRKVFDSAVAWASVRAGLELLAERTAEAGRGILLAEVAGGWQFLTREEHWPRVQRVARTRQEEKLTPAAIETLSVIAYKQPITRSEVDGLRGVSSSSLVKALEQRGLVKVVGRADQPGQPYQYGTTRRFLEHFGLRSVRDLPDPRSAARPLAAGESPES